MYCVYLYTVYTVCIVCTMYVYCIYYTCVLCDFDAHTMYVYVVYRAMCTGGHIIPSTHFVISFFSFSSYKDSFPLTHRGMTSFEGR